LRPWRDQLNWRPASVSDHQESQPGSVFDETVDIEEKKTNECVVFFNSQGNVDETSQKRFQSAK
jgi:hypothetical protein